MNVATIEKLEITSYMRIPLYNSRVKAGFPSPADPYLDKVLDLNELCIKHPEATYFVRVSGDSMIDAGIYSGDILIVDRALEPFNNKIVVAAVDDEFTVKRLKRIHNRVFLWPENKDYEPIEITENCNVEIFGVVTFSFKAH